jgi:hypothetical protein
MKYVKKKDLRRKSVHIPIHRVRWIVTNRKCTS